MMTRIECKIQFELSRQWSLSVKIKGVQEVVLQTEQVGLEVSL
jgi:hypothetical protein